MYRGAGPLKHAVDRRHRGFEQVGNLGRLPSEHVAQDEHRALGRGQTLQDSDERQRDRLAALGDRGGVGVCGGQLVEQRIGVGRQV